MPFPVDAATSILESNSRNRFKSKTMPSNLLVYSFLIQSYYNESNKEWMFLRNSFEIRINWWIISFVSIWFLFTYFTDHRFDHCVRDYRLSCYEIWHQISASIRYSRLLGLEISNFSKEEQDELIFALLLLAHFNGTRPYANIYKESWIIRTWRLQSRKTAHNWYYF